jgi:hypothetical protein
MQFRDDTGAPTTRTVYIYNEDMKLVRTAVSTGGTLQVSFSQPNGKALAVCLDDAAGTTYNDLAQIIAPE